MTSPVRVAVAGAAGRMGQELLGLIEAAPDLQLAAAVDRQEPGGSALMPTASGAQVMVDFSSPELLRQVAQWCQQNKVPLVSGTTGISQSDFELLREVSKVTAVMWAANMSLGVAVLTEALKVFKSVAP